MGSQKRLGIVAGVLVVLGALQWQFNIIPTKAIGKSQVAQEVELNVSDGPIAHQTISAPLVEPCSGGLAHVAGPQVRINVWEWNAQMGLIGANCGPKTQKGSLIEKHGVNLVLNLQNDTEKSKVDQLKFASLMANGDPNPAEGVQFVIIMGDGAASYLYDMNKKLTKLGLKAEVVGAVGYSRGEDGFWGPQAWKDDPSSMRGKLSVGVIRDGDWNIAQAYLTANGICNNPDERYYDPNCMNWVNSDDYLKAVETVVNGYTDKRKTVKDGKVMNDPLVTLTAEGVVTWTPGDVNLAKKKGGFVRLLSTKENKYQMPAVVIGIDKWNNAHSKQIEGLLAATFEYGDQLKAYPEALTRAAKASYAVYGEETPAYWAKYYKGTKEKDATGYPVELGGSYAINYADNQFLFGMLEGGGGIEGSPFKAAYEGFGNVASKQYPTILPSFPKSNEAVNLRFLTELASVMAPSKADLPTFTSNEGIADENKVSKRDVSINFAPGSATFSADTLTTLDLLYSQVANAAALQVELDGHTDNTGTPDGNLDLSTRRAQAVKDYWTKKNPLLFPDSRVSVRGYGQTKPIAPNDTPSGRAANRRVSIILGESN